MTKTHFIGFTKWTPEGPVRIEVAIPADNKQEAKEKAVKIMQQPLEGFRLQGNN